MGEFMIAATTEQTFQVREPKRRLADAATFSLYALPFFATALAYGLLGALPRNSRVAVAELYDLEQRLFPVHTSAGVRAISEVLAQNQNVLLDVVCGATYLLFLPEIVVLAGYFFFRDRPKMLEISLGFLVINLLGWAIWLSYPAAPPWYVDAYGKGPPLLEVASNPASLTRVDALLGIPYFSTFYSKSAYVFGAMPSLHMGYATLAAIHSWPYRNRLRATTLVFAVAMAFSALYLRHHYLLDVIAGAALAVPTVLVVRALLRRFGSRERRVAEVRP